jgi:hypothetical protein
LRLILFMASVALAELGMLSFLVALAYWPIKGAGVAGLVGALMVAVGAAGLLRSCGALVGSPKNKRERTAYY